MTRRGVGWTEWLTGLWLMGALPASAAAYLISKDDLALGNAVVVSFVWVLALPVLIAGLRGAHRAAATAVSRVSPAALLLAVCRICR